MGVRQAPWHIPGGFGQGECGITDCMKSNIHPTYYAEAAVKCMCGNEFTTGSTVPEIKTEVCNVCHPFYTGTQRIVDTGGQVERFRRRAEKAAH